jgi:phospholipase/carboxylesterase
MTHRYLPSPFPGSAITVVLCPDAEADQNDFLPIGRAVAPKASLLSIGGTLAKADFAAVGDQLAALLQQYSAQSVLAVGYAEGASVAVSLMVCHPEIVAAAVLLRPRLLMSANTPPSADLKGKQVLILAGAEDPVSPVAETEALAQMLSSAGATVEVRWAEGGHEMTPQDFQATRDFLAQCAVSA